MRKWEPAFSVFLFFTPSDFRMHHFSAVVKAKASASFQLLHKNEKRNPISGGEELEEELCSAVLSARESFEFF